MDAKGTATAAAGGRITAAAGGLRRRDAEANRAALLEAAQRTLADDPHASLDAIAHAAGLSRRSVYGHFADRETLVHEVIALGAERFNALAAQATHADARVALGRLAARLWREASAVRASAGIALDSVHAPATAAALAPLRRGVRAIVDAGIASGAFRGDVPAEALARLVEESARAALRGGVLGTSEAASLVVRVVLSVAGLSWREQVELFAAHPEMLAER